MAGKDFINRLLLLILRPVLALILTLMTLQSYAQETDNTAMAPTGSATSCSDTNDCLNSIVQNTYQLLLRVNTIPEQLKNISTMALSWLANDDSETTGKLANSFSTLGSTINRMNDEQLDYQTTMAGWIFSPGSPGDLTTPADSPKILGTLKRINDVTFSTLLGRPAVPKAPRNPPGTPDAALMYVLNASGANVVRTVPDPTWHGRSELDTSPVRYSSYYYTTMAVESFNAYVLSKLYLDNKPENENKVGEIRKSLIAQASDSNWLTTIASEDLGKVLRQLLMFQSQSYVLLTELIEIQKQVLTAQVMSNGLLIVNNAAQEDYLLPNAQGKQR